jgi:mannosyl-glycoprotein endo-beta-N-acetylglucosaminidase
VARKCQFDGYLINVETKINQIEKLKQWLALLTTKIHEYIPNSLIIWYDSITSSTGEISYQNELNNSNSIFYKLTDGFFTNYWWN